MRERIARETRRQTYDNTDAVFQAAINDAINTAISQYQAERWLFNESRDHTFPTVPSQFIYTVADVPDLALLQKIDFVTIEIADTVFELSPDSPRRIEVQQSVTASDGQSSWYLFFNQSLRLFPSPSDIWPVRITGVFTVAAPATADETGNPWMTEAELLIRSRAKYELALQVLYDDQLAARMTNSVVDAVSQLKRRTNRIQQHWNGKVKPMVY